MMSERRARGGPYNQSPGLTFRRGLTARPLFLVRGAHKSTIGAKGAFFFTDSMPFSRLAALS